MELIIRLVLVAACLLALSLGLKMALKKAGRGRITDREGLTFARTVLATLILCATVIWLIRPEFGSLAFPTAVKAIGTALFIISWSFRVWAQFHLGVEWSNNISPREGGRLVMNGPYRWVRHPIYASYLIITPGLFAMTTNYVLGGLAVAYTLVTLLRIKAEEQRLVEVHKTLYKEYTSSTLALIYQLVVLRESCAGNIDIEKMLFNRPKTETLTELARLDYELSMCRQILARRQANKPLMVRVVKCLLACVTVRRAK